MRSPETSAIYFSSGARVVAEVVRDQADLERGLSRRVAVPEGTGMLFDMGRTDAHRFWMRGTLVALDIVFLAADGAVVGVVEDARPLDATPRWVPQPSRYVLEVPAGWCARSGVVVGERAVFVALPA